VYTGVRVIDADDESFTLMMPESHPESGWNTFSAYRDDDGTTIAQIQSLARANDPIYEIGFRIVGSTSQERIWTHVLKSLAARLSVNEPVSLEKVCVDPRLQWSQVKNVWQNAGARSMLYTMVGLERRMRNLIRPGLPDDWRGTYGIPGSAIEGVTERGAYKAVVVGAGPNGLAAAVELARGPLGGRAGGGGHHRRRCPLG
jgi:hypothetical protein